MNAVSSVGRHKHVFDYPARRLFHGENNYLEKKQNKKRTTTSCHKKRFNVAVHGVSGLINIHVSPMWCIQVDHSFTLQLL